MNFDDTAVAFQSKSDRDLKRTHFVFSTMKKPWMVKAGTFFTTLALRLQFPVKGIIKRTIFSQFCGGESIKDCQATISQLGAFNVKTILDYSVEGQEEERSFDAAMEEALRVADFARDNPNIPFCVLKLTGLGSKTLMKKVQDGEDLTFDESAAVTRMKERVMTVAKRAAENGLKFMLDAEESWIQNTIDEVSYELMLQLNRKQPVVYTTYQFYRHEALHKMKSAYERITADGAHFAAKLVRGAYMETERDRARELGYTDPIQPDKQATDRDFNLAQEFIIDHIDRFAMCAGTHNEHSSALLVRLMKEKGLAKNDPRVYFAQLLGMSDNISYKLADEGYNVAKYVPYGPVAKVLPYLFRRAEENTSIAGQSSREFSLVTRELLRRKHNR